MRDRAKELPNGLTRMNDKRTVRMTEGRPFGLLITFMIPVIGTNIMQQIYAMADSIIVGQGVGVEALAAIGATDWLRNAVMWAIFGLCDGFAILSAIAYGKKNREETKSSICNTLFLGLIIGLVCSVLGVLLARPLLLLIGTEKSILEQAVWYLGISYAGSAFMMMFNLGASVLKGLGDSRTSFYAIILSSVINIGLDLLFVFVFRWGIIGAAVATFIAQMVSGGFCLLIVLRLPLLKAGASFRPNPRWMSRLLSKGVPMALNMSIVAIGGIILQTVINAAGFDYIAAFAATNKMILIYEGIAIALGSALTTYVGQNFGAGCFGRIKDGVKTALVIGAAVSAVLGALLIVFGKYLMMLFIQRDSSTFDQIVAIGSGYFTVVGIGLFSLYALHIYRQSLMGLGNTFWPLLSGAGEFIGRVGTGLVLTQIWGFQALYGAEVAAFVLADLFLVIPYYRILRKEEKKSSKNGSEVLQSQT